MVHFTIRDSLCVFAQQCNGKGRKKVKGIVHNAFVDVVKISLKTCDFTFRFFSLFCPSFFCFFGGAISGWRTSLILFSFLSSTIR